ncbi:MAG: general secretion pathway protein D [Pseudomonadales bacterium]|jgi:general secretion pathway protein D
MLFTPSIKKAFASRVNHRLNSFVMIFLTTVLVVIPTDAITAEQSQERNISISMEQGDIRELIRWASTLVTKNIVIHPSVSGQVTILAGDPMSKKEAYDVFLSTLEVHGYSAIELDDVIKIIPNGTEPTSPLIDEKSSSQASENNITKIVRLKHIDASETINLVKPLAAKGSSLIAEPSTNSLIISGRYQQIEHLLTIISKLDITSDVDAEIIAINYADAGKIVDILNKITAKQKSSANSKITIVAEPRTNSILIAGNSSEKRQLRILIGRLDNPQDTQGNAQVIFLNYVEAAKLMPTLRAVATGLRSNVSSPGERIETTIEINEQTNSLVITGSPDIIKSLRAIIDQLDIRRAQVLVEALIVEVNEERLKDLGIQWQTDVPSDGVFAGQNTITKNINIISPPTIASGLTLGLFKDDQLRAMIRALENDTAANVLSTPTIVVLDNEEAEILVGENVPFITGQSTNASSSTDNPFQTIQRQDIGVTLKVKPRINNDGSINLEVNQTVESISDTSATTADIVTNKRAINTHVLIDDDAILVLGGLIRDEITQTESKIPLLGDIPYLGRLFKSTSDKIVKKNLMVFLHPKILYTESDNNLVTKKRYKQMQLNQYDMNEDLDNFLLPGSGSVLEEFIEQNRAANKQPSEVNEQPSETPEDE